MPDPFEGLALATEEARRMTIVHPVTQQPLRDAEGGEAWIALYANDSEVARRHNRSVAQRRTGHRARITGQDDLDAELAAKLAAQTADWRLLTLDGEPLVVACTTANARALFAAAPMCWLRDQALVFVDDRANFAPASSRS